MIATIQPTHPSQIPDTPLHHDIPEEGHEEVPEQRSVEAISNYGSTGESQIEKQQSASAASTRSESAAGTLRPLKKLYGRDDEINIIREEYHRAMSVEAHTNNNKANLVVIRGADGVGKTSVALSIQDTVIEDGGFLLNWEFDPLNTMEAGNGFDDGFEDLCRQIHRSSEKTQHKLREAIRAAGPVDCATLLDMIPCLNAIIGDKEYSGGFKSVESAGKHMQVLTGFLNCFRKANVPLVILLNDLAGSDPCSCLLLTQIIPSFTAGGVLCLATIGPQPNERVDGIVRNLAEKLRLINLELENIQEDKLNVMIADMLHVTKDISVPMTKFLHHHSRGNPMFAMELLRLMVDTRILKYDANQKTWNCEEPQIDLVDQCRDFDQLMRYKLTCAAPGELLELLKVASCFGNKVDVRLLEVAMVSSPMCQLKIATSLDLLLVVNEEKGIYRFAHSGVRRGAYDLIAKQERESLHVVIARRLLQKLTDCQRHKYVSVILGQIRMGIASLEEQAERAVMAGVCLEGAQKALEWSGFVVAFECLELGISLLGENGWRDHYDLTLALYNSAAECGHTMGSFSEALELVDVVLRNARVFDDKLQAYFTQLYIVGSKHDTKTALRVGVDVLGQLGVNVPLDPSAKELKRETTNLLRFMKGKTPETLLRLPNMTDKRMASAMQIANLIITSAFHARPHLGTLLVLRAMRITVTHGLCAISSYMFGLYGALVCGRLENIDEGTRYGDAALQLLDRFKAREWAPRVYVAVYGCVYIWTKDLRYCIEKLRRGQNIGFESGDNQFAMLSGNIRLALMMALGEPLPLVKKDSEMYSNELKMFNQTAMVYIHRPFEATIKALARDPDIPEDASFQEDCCTGEEVLMECWQNYHMSIIAYFRKDYAQAVDLADRSEATETFTFKTIDLSTFHMFRALSHIANYQATGQGKRKALGIARSYESDCENCQRLIPAFVWE